MPEAAVSSISQTSRYLIDLGTKRTSDVQRCESIGMKRAGIIALYLVALVIFGAAARVPVGGAIVTLVSLAAMGLAGVVILSYLAPNLKSPVCFLIFGTTLGLACGRFLLVVFDLCLGPSFLAAALAFGLLPAVALPLLLWRSSELPRWSAEEQSELDWLFSLNTVVLLAMAAAYWGVGRLTSGGYAFAPYFFLDFLSHATCASALARQFPPENPYFVGQVFHYYWFYHLWPAAIINLSGITARTAVTLTQPANAFLLVGSLVCLVRVYMPRLWARHMAIGLGLFAFSFIGIFFVIRNARWWWLELIHRHLNTWASYLSHSWYRDLLYEPHAVTALSGVVFLVYLETASMTRASRKTSLLAGMILGAIAVTDLFIGMIALLWFGAMNAAPFLREKQSRYPIAVAAFAAAAVVSGGFALQLFPARSGQLLLGVHPVTKFGPFYLLVELGPVFVFGIAGLYLCLCRRQIVAFRPILILLIVTLIVTFTVIVPVEVNQVIRKSTKVVQIPLVVLAALACEACLCFPGRRWLRWVGATVVAGGFVTFCTDVFQYTDIEPSKTCATCYVSPDRMRALEWIRNHTPPSAIVQLLDEVRPKRKMAINFDISVPAISERSALFGNYKYLYLTHVEERLINDRKAILEDVFTAARADELKQCLERLPSCYLVVDQTAPGPLKAVCELVDSGDLKEVFRFGSVSVVWKGDSGFDHSPKPARDRVAVVDER
jgi:hypothetical protein